MTRDMMDEERNEGLQSCEGLFSTVLVQFETADLGTLVWEI